MNKSIIAIIQARMGSTRLPKKVLMPILGKSVLYHIINRLKNVEKITDILVATSNNELDQRIEDFCKLNNVSCYRGSEKDVLDRFYESAKKVKADFIIRITGDCPLIDPLLIDNLIKYFFDNKFDYCAIATGAGVSQDNLIKKYPDGMDSEIFTFDVLKSTWEEANQAQHREHVTPFIWTQTSRFNIGYLGNEDLDYGNIRLTLDKQEDFELIKWVYEELYPLNKIFGLPEIINLIKNYPDRFLLNKHLIGKEGYDEF